MRVGIKSGFNGNTSTVLLLHTVPLFFFSLSLFLLLLLLLLLVGRNVLLISIYTSQRGTTNSHNLGGKTTTLLYVLA